MNPTLTTTGGNGGNFDPQQAAALLDEATRQARRRLEPFPPWGWAIRGAAVLAVCGAAWLSVRGQHPYKGPTAAVLPVVFGFVALNLIGTAVVAKRATAGVWGRSRLRPAETAVMVAVWLGVFVAMGALAGAGVSDSIVYGVYPTTAPLVAAGLAWAGIMAARANWRRCASALVVAAVGGGGVLAGPVWSWLVAGVGLFAVCLGNAGAIARRQRA